MNSRRILVAGVGNIFLGDDAFGVEVIKVLSQRTLPACVKIHDFGIRGFDLSFALVEFYDLILIVDVVQRGEPPGTLYVLEPDLSALAKGDSIPTHGMIPTRAFEFARSLGAAFNEVRIIGCEPGRFESAEELSDLTPEVRSAVDEAASLIEKMVQEFLNTKIAYA